MNNNVFNLHQLGFLKNPEIMLTSILGECCKEILPDIGGDFSSKIFFEPSKNKTCGDYSSNVCMRLASTLKMDPKSAGDKLIGLLNKKFKDTGLDIYIQDINVAGHGFLNVLFSRQYLLDSLKNIVLSDAEYGICDDYKGQKLLLEFVSANPTGPLSIAHARQAVVGDSLSNIMKCCGCDVTKEYYINDEGNQIRILGLSVFLRYKELFGIVVKFPEDGYKGDYIKDIAAIVKEQSKDKYVSKPSDDADTITIFSEFSANYILDEIKKDLEDFGVSFDNWFSQKSLSANNLIELVLKEMESKKLTYQKDGALWFRSTDYGDDKDRVLIKSDGEQTYLAPDIAYHKKKYERGYTRLVNIWGPDHHGYIPRIKAAVSSLGYKKESLDVIILQLTSLYRNGVQVKMSTRAGELVSLRQLLDEIGKDATRFFLMSRKGDSHLDFDLDLAKKTTSENPVYYVQYAHARISSILNSTESTTSLNLEKINTLGEKEELDLIKVLCQYTDTLKICAVQLDPYRLTLYLRELAGAFHVFYSKHRVLGVSEDLSNARLVLINAVRIVLRNGLRVLGVSFPEKM